mgnify:CR=1 FL=1
MCPWERDRECVCVWERERDRETECVCVCVCVCVRERERERESLLLTSGACPVDPLCTCTPVWVHFSQNPLGRLGQGWFFDAHWPFHTLELHSGQSTCCHLKENFPSIFLLSFPFIFLFFCGHHKHSFSGKRYKLFLKLMLWQFKCYTPVTMTVLMLASRSWCIMGVVSGFSRFSITKNPRNVKLLSTCSLR